MAAKKKKAKKTAKKQTKKKMSKKQQKLELEGDGLDLALFNLSPGAKRTIWSIIAALIGVIFMAGFFEAGGKLGIILTDLVSKGFGWLGKFFAPLVCFFIAYILLRKKKTSFYVTKIFGVIVLFVAILGLLHLPLPVEEFKSLAAEGKGGGVIGYSVATALVSVAGKLVATLVLVAAIVIAAIVAFNMSFVGAADKIKKPDLKKGMNLGGGLFKKSKDGEEYEDDFDEDEEEFDASGEVDEDEEENELTTDGFDDANVYIDQKDQIKPAEAIPAVPTAAEKAADLVKNQKVPERTPAPEREYNDDEWELPPLRLLGAGSSKAKGGDVKERAQIIQDTFANFNINMELEDIITGPTVTQYSFRPPSGVKLTKITTLGDDLALALAAHPIRIEAPIPGKSLVGIEVPNTEKSMVRIRNIINTEEFENPEKKLLLALGEDVNGDYVVEDLGKMPHLLVAGATGAGKSVAVNSILLSLLYKNSPQDLKMILVDPKRVELSLYNGIPHLLSDVITDNGKVLNALKWAVAEMERRYKLLQAVGTRDLASYSEKRKAGETYKETDPETGETTDKELEHLPVIIIVIDEMADLMGTHGKEVEGIIVRLAQMSRAVAIHLILSTQRPSVDVITGTIKANLPTRIALRVATNIDSRTIIDRPGAEKLVGHGDMLFVGPSSPSPHRLQGVYVGEDEVKKVIDYIKKQARQKGAYEIDEDFGESDGTKGVGSASGVQAVDFDNVATTASGIGGDNTDLDPMFEQAKEEVIKVGKASTSYIQRRLRVGYSRAARIMDELEDQGIIGPAEGSKARKVLVSSPEEETAPVQEAPAQEEKDDDEW